MKIIYRADNILEAHIIAGMLNAADIPAHVGGHHLQGAVGEIAPVDFSTIIVDPEHETAAKVMISDYEQGLLTLESPAEDNGKQ